MGETVDCCAPNTSNIKSDEKSEKKKNKIGIAILIAVAVIVVIYLISIFSGGGQTSSIASGGAQMVGGC